MRISNKLTAVVLVVFLIVCTVAAFALVRLRDMAQQSVETQARNIANTMASMAAHEITHGGPEDRHARFQHVINFLATREKRDLEIFDTNLVVVADVDSGDVGQPIEAGPRRDDVEHTLKDGKPRLIIEAATAHSPEMRQAVVPVYDAQHAIVAALAFEYTPLYNELLSQSRRSIQVIGAAALFGLMLALGCAAYVSRNVSRPLAYLTQAALQLAHGRRDVSVAVDTRDEIGELATVFNTMSTALRASEADLENRANDLLMANQSLLLRDRAIASCFNAIIIADLTRPGFPIEYVNPAFGRMTGYSAIETLGQPSEFMVKADDDQAGLEELRLALRERREARVVVRSYRKDGTPFWNEVYVAPVRADTAVHEHYIAIFNDITDARNDAEQLARHAQFDMLTGLANRNLLTDRLTQAIASAQRRGDSVVVAFIDLAGFKVVNDSLGHEFGDQLLQEVAARLQGCVRVSDTVARFGSDEFVLVLNQGTGTNICAETHIAEQVRKIVDCIAAPMTLAGKDINVSCSIGLSAFPQDGQDAETLIKHADIAMYRAKELGRDGFQFFTAELQDRAHKQLQLGVSLRQAIERDEFELHYQPQVSLRNGKVVGIEALLRWRHPELGLLGPGHFIAFAEETGLIIPIGEWVLMRACAQNKAWQDAGLPAIPVAVNVSAKQCAQHDLEAIVRRALDHSGLAAHFLELEFTESISMANPEESVPMMARMKEIGVALSIDDFGTGYSNMSYLRRFPIDRLKLDMSFVRDITTDSSSLAISDAIITMAHSLHLEVVAEGVETKGQLELLKSRNCDIMQGYFFSKPLPVTELEQLLRNGRRLPADQTARAPDAPALLLLDDDPLLLEYLTLVLTAEGYVVHATDSPKHAFNLLACNEVAVVLCDQRMPAMNGIEFLSRVRRMYPDTVRIMLSAYDDSSITRQAINISAVHKFIEKSSCPDELKEVVDDAFRLYLNLREPALT